MTYQPNPNHNHLLAALSSEVKSRLFPHLELVSLELRKVLFECHQPMEHVYFPTNSIISLQYLLESGTSTGISIVGNEGLLGVSLYMGDKERTLSRSLVQCAGFAYRLSRRKVKEEFNRHGELLSLMLRYTQALLVQVSQTAVCNRNHCIFQQLCRWLLISMDRQEGNHLTMTQEFIADMLGVRREGITEAALELQNLGVISYRRGLIDVLDRAKLEELSCECYRMVQEETKHLLSYLPHREAGGQPEPIPSGTH